MPKETYRVARERLMREALALGWTVKRFSSGMRPLVVPWVEPPDDWSGIPVRAYFKRQAVYFSRDTLKDGRSSGLDIRGMSITDFEREMRGWKG